jgi:hypothetical protein
VIPLAEVGGEGRYRWDLGVEVEILGWSPSLMPRILVPTNMR